jgi:hypothetical protein
MMVLPSAYKFLLIAPYVVLLLIGIRKTNQMQARIRLEESQSSCPSQP